MYIWRFFWQIERSPLHTSDHTKKKTQAIFLAFCSTPPYAYGNPMPNSYPTPPTRRWTFDVGRLTIDVWRCSAKFWIHMGTRLGTRCQLDATHYKGGHCHHPHTHTYKMTKNSIATHWLPTESVSENYDRKNLDMSLVWHHLHRCDLSASPPILERPYTALRVLSIGANVDNSPHLDLVIWNIITIRTYGQLQKRSKVHPQKKFLDHRYNVD